jgi:hypothetical protein
VRGASRTSEYGFLDVSSVPALLEALQPVFDSCHEVAVALAETIPRDEVWKWKDLWIAPLRAAVFSVVLARFLTDGTLASLPSVAEQLGSTCATSLASLWEVK